MLWLKGRLIRTLKNKIYKYIASALKNVYTDILADIQMFHKKQLQKTNQKKEMKM